MQVDMVDIIKTGQIVYLEDEKGKSWPFGVSNILNHELIVCHALGRKSTPMKSSSNIIKIVKPEDNGAFLIMAKIVEADDTNSRLILQPIEETDHIQRRQYFRIPKPSVLVHYQLGEGDTYEDITKPIEGMAWDLSGNGIGILVRNAKTIYTDSPIKIIISLPNESPIEIVGEVVRVIPKSIIKNEYLIGVNFKRIHERDRDKILKFITQEQLTLRKVKKKA